MPAKLYRYRYTKERLVDKKKLVLWEQTGGDKEIEWQFPTTTIANWITTQLPPETNKNP